jgi:hypothetical protein
MTSALPKAVREQIEQADKLQQQLYGQTDEGTPATADPAPEPAAAPTDEPAATTPEPSAAPMPEAVAPAAKSDSEETFQKRYQVLQGKYNAEVPRLYAQLKDVAAQNAALAEQLRALQQAQAKPAHATESDATISAKDVEAFGGDLVDLIERGARKAVNEARQDWAQREQQLLARIQTLQARVGDVGEQVLSSAQDRFYSAISERVPDWETINKDANFLAWLEEADPIYGVTRQQALNDAADRLDAGRAAAVFEAFKALTYVAPKAPMQANSNRSELARQVAPNTSRSSAPTAPTAKIWTKADYERAFDYRVTRHMSPDEVRQMQAEADLAAGEGRVQW